MTIDEFKAYIPLAKPGDQQRLREAARLMEKFDLAPVQFFNLTKSQMKDYIEEYVADIPAGEKVPALMETPDLLIRVLLHAYKRMCERHPEHDLPDREAPESRRLLPLAEAKRPKRLKKEVASWRPRLEGEPHGTGMGGPLTKSIAKSYVVRVWQYCAILVACGTKLNDAVTFEAVTHPSAQQLVFRRLSHHYAKKTIPSFLGALHRVAKDLLGKDHANTVSFAVARRNNKDTQTLSASIIQECRDLNGSGALDTAMVTIWDLPRLMWQRSEMPGLRAHDKDARKGYAIAVEIAMEVTSMAAASLYDLNFVTDVISKGEQRYLKFIDKLGVADMSLLTKDLWDSIDALADFRLSYGRQSPWLFSSGYDTKKKSKQCTANLLATAMEAALRKRITITRVQDAVIINAIDTGNIDPVALSAEHGHKLPKSFRERYKVALRSPAKKSKGGK